MSLVENEVCTGACTQCQERCEPTAEEFNDKNSKSVPKASDLVEALVHLIQTHGDCPVFSYDELSGHVMRIGLKHRQKTEQSMEHFQINVDFMPEGLV